MIPIFSYRTIFIVYVVVVMMIASIIEIQAFQQQQQQHPRQFQQNKSSAAGAKAFGRIATILLEAAKDDGRSEKGKGDSLSGMIAGFDTVPVQRPKRVAFGADNYDKDKVRSIVENMIKDEKVLIISSSTCPYCDTVKGLLKSKGVQFKVEEIDGRQDIRAEMAEIIGRSSVPAVFIDGAYVGGCNDGGKGGVLPLDESGELDKILSSAGALP